MPRPANEHRFGDTSGGEWYNPPYPRTIAGAQAFGYFEQRAAWLADRYGDNQRIGIAGAGFGWTGYFLWVNHNIDPFMCDLQWAANIGAGVIPGGTSRIRNLDMLSANQADQFRRMANQGNQRRWPVFGEDILPSCESISEVQTMLANLRSTTNELIHLISPLMDEFNDQSDDMLWLPMEQWREIIGPDEVIINPNFVEY